MPCNLELGQTLGLEVVFDHLEVVAVAADPAAAAAAAAAAALCARAADAFRHTLLALG